MRECLPQEGCPGLPLCCTSSSALRLLPAARCARPPLPTANCSPATTPMPARCSNYTARYTSRIASISGNEVTLERPLPWALLEEMEPALVRRQAPVYDVGLEGFTLQVWSAVLGCLKPPN